MSHTIVVSEGELVDLAAIETRANGGLTKEEGNAAFAELATELGELQELLYAAGSQSLLVILQGLDTSGKDGTIGSVFREANPVGVRVAAFKVPTERELAHDFLWRIHQQTPARGEVVAFNRSHYEDVVVARVHDLVPEAVWRSRYEDIEHFERLLTKNETIVLKFYLHISQQEQEARLLARERDITKAWKLSASDWVERRSWTDYLAAYQDAIVACSTAVPWQIVPADRKWYRNLAIAEAIVAALRPHRETWLSLLERRGKAELEAIQEARAAMN